MYTYKNNTDKIKQLTSGSACAAAFLPFFSVFFATDLAASDTAAAMSNTQYTVQLTIYSKICYNYMQCSQWKLGIDCVKLCWNWGTLTRHSNVILFCHNITLTLIYELLHNEKLYTHFQTPLNISFLSIPFMLELCQLVIMFWVFETAH